MAAMKTAATALCAVLLLALCAVLLLPMGRFSGANLRRMQVVFVYP